MIKKFIGGLVLGAAALVLASCGEKPKDDTPAPETPVAAKSPEVKETPIAKAGPHEVKLHVDGMVERLNLV